MIYTGKKFDLMLESAWRAFESTLMLHGMSKKEVAHFKETLDSSPTLCRVYEAVSETVEWEETE